MSNQPPKKSFFASLILHVIVLIVLIAGFDYSATMPVFQNTNDHDVISAVILGDTEKSKILPDESVKTAPPSPPVVAKKEEEIKTPPPPPVKTVEKPIVLKKVVTKKPPKKPAFSAKNLLADIQETNQTRKKTKQIALKKSFETALKQHAEATLRQQLLDEDIKLQTAKERRAQGEVNKYKSLIIQSISEHWLVPSQVNKKLYCELMIRLAPGGMVLDVEVTKSSGDPALDRSARAAVLQASPLPVPTDELAFKEFRRFVLKVRPENMLAG